eukprot:UN10385
MPFSKVINLHNYLTQSNQTHERFVEYVNKQRENCNSNCISNNNIVAPPQNQSKNQQNKTNNNKASKDNITTTTPININQLIVYVYCFLI